MKLTLLTALLAVGFAAQTQASIIAVIDSGTDLSHPQLVNKKWTNPKDVDDAVDNDDNGYIDDINGWNFAEQNNKLYDKSYLGTFSPDVYKFFEVQTRLLKGVGTAEDTAWMQAARQNKDLIAELGTFGNFVHGTHVAGISAKNANGAQIMGVKIIPTKAPTLPGGDHKNGVSDLIIKQGLKLLASQQGKALAPVAQYVNTEKARVANCSFGTSTEAAKMVLQPLLKTILKRDPTAEELATYSAYFVSEIVKVAQSSFTALAKNTLFVIAAGNDGMDNDKYPTSPANVKADNTITVAATLGYDKLASFSNYGEKMVEVAAPGVGIESSIPGNQMLTVSGTSQAAPFVTNIAGMVLDENPALSNADVKKILMDTSDVKAFLKGKVVSNGIVNTNRAIMAAKLSKTMQLKEAIQASKLQVSDVDARLYQKYQAPGDYEGFVIPMPGLFN